MLNNKMLMTMKCLFFMTILSLLLFSCTKDVQLKNLNFDVSVEKEIYKVGEKVIFRFSGSSPDVISFYPGEGISDYAYLNEDQYVPTKLALSFQSAKFAGTNEDCARLKYSIDFNGVYEEAAIHQATWVDISDRFYIPPIVGTGPTFSHSGIQDITDLFEDTEGPIYLAWFYDLPDRTGNADNRRTRFRMQNFVIEATIAENPNFSQLQYDFASSEFQLVTSISYEQSPPADGVPIGERPRFVENGTSLLFDGPFVNDVHRQAWAITKGLYKSELVNIGPAIGIPIKSFNSPVMDSYSHVFTEPGTYVVTFVVRNVNVYDSKSAVHQIEIVVEE